MLLFFRDKVDGGMSLNLTVPTDSPNVAANAVLKRSKTPVGAVKASSARNATNRNSGISLGGRRAKSKSPNPSFCSVLSRVKDWEIGHFISKSPLAIDNDSCATNSQVSNPMLCPSTEGRGGAWRASGSPEVAPEAENTGPKLQKSTLSSNIGKSFVFEIRAFLCNNASTTYLCVTCKN